ncbi:response regulator [Adhaeribacter sp. BT258]|uniref:Response regulator n=1 Tax=Adhaeribacter terrigena TaxID=2793070 RepID=A0ABS1C1A3_9BACT|nr:response regulator [Adhaeribacter terrigena]MBK0403181.1 response regulator [Adhaeribacter terrigena]
MLKRIFIVDDDEISVFLTESILERHGYLNCVKSYLDPIKAFAEILQTLQESSDGHYLIFLDLNMPIMSGWDFLDKLSAYEASLKGKCHVVILSSAVDGREIARSSQYPLVLNFVPKPLDPTAFELILETLQNNGALPAGKS